jgi:hypothetical protein
MPSWSGHTNQYSKLKITITQGTEADNRPGHIRFCSLSQCSPGYFRYTPRFQSPVSERVSVGIAKWPEVLKNAYRCLKPGGYVELSELGSEFSSFLSQDNYSQ